MLLVGWRGGLRCWDIWLILQDIAVFLAIEEAVCKIQVSWSISTGHYLALCMLIHVADRSFQSHC